MLKNLIWITFFCLSNLVYSQVNFDTYKISNRVDFSFEVTNEMMLLDVRFQNVLPLKFIFDTGSEHSILFKKEYSDLLGLEYQKRIPLVGSDLSQEIYAYICRGVKLNIENALVANTDMLVLENDYLGLDEYTGTNIDGIIGANIFRRVVVHIDNKHNKIEFIIPEKFKPPKRYTAIPIDIYKNKPFINVSTVIDKELMTLRLLMDTGAALPVLLYTNTHENLKLPPETITGNIGMGLGGLLEGYVGRLENLSFGEFEFANLISSFQELDLDSLPVLNLNRNGLLGNALLSRFNFYIDYINEILYIKPNKRYSKKFRFDKSGILVAATGPFLKSFVIQRIMPGTPGEEAGLRQGDVIKKVKGIPVQFLSLASITSIFSKRSGQRIRVTVTRQGERIKTTIKLRDLI